MTNEEEFREWLEGQSQEVCTAIAYRAVIRVLPWATQVPKSDREAGRSLACFRAALATGVSAARINSVAREAAYGFLMLYQDANRIMGAENAVLAAVETAAVHDAGFAYKAVDAAAVVAAEAVADPEDQKAAFNAAFSYAWSASYYDTTLTLNELLSSEILQSAGLKAALSQIQTLCSASGRKSRSWGFWGKWYKHALNGGPLSWELQEQIAFIEDEIWEAGPEAVAEAIEKLEFQFRTAIAPRLIRDEDANLFRVEDDPDVPPDIAEFMTHRAQQALNATLASVSDNIFNAGSYEAIVISETLGGPKTLSLLALGLYDACLGLDANIGDRYPEELALINLQNSLASIVDELCELDDDAKHRCARRAGYVASPIGDTLTREELESIPQLTAPELEPVAREIIESDVERILADEAAMPRWRKIRLANWMTTISIYWDRTKKGFKEAETLAKIVSKLRSAWRHLDGGDGS